MRKAKTLLTLTLLSMSATLPTPTVSGQIIYTQTPDTMKMDDRIWNQGMDRMRVIEAANSQRRAGIARTMAREAGIDDMESIGAARIKAGKATTRFNPTLAGTQAAVGNMAWNDEGDPQTLDGQIKHVQRYVKIFNTLMQRNGFTPNDSSDGYAFAFTLAYAAYNDRDMNKAEVEKLRQKDQKEAMASALFQGMSDEKRQKWYELNLMMAIQAVEQRALARRATSEAERRQYEAKAQRFAKYILGDKQN